MPIIKQKDKKSGRIYVYEAITKYDPEKKCTVYASRKLIGLSILKQIKQF